jgi:hypothetical protein
MAPLTVSPNNATSTYNGSAYSGGSGIGYTATSGDGNVLGTPIYGGSSQGAVNAGNYTLTMSGLYSDQQGYIISYAGGSLTINPLPVAVAAVSGATRVYDGSAAVPTSLLTLTNLVTGDTVTLTGSATLAGSGVGAENLIDLSGLTLDNPNYTLVGANSGGSVLVTARPVDVAAISGATRVFDGTAAAAASLLTITNLVTGDSVTLTGSATLATADVGTQNLVGLDGLTLNNPNYTVSGGSVAGSVVITAASSGSTGGTGSPGGTGSTGGSEPPGGNGPAVESDPTLANAIASAMQTRVSNTGGTPSSSSGAPPGGTVFNSTPANATSTAATGSSPVPQLATPEVTSALGATFGANAQLTVVSSPSGDESTLAVSLSEARQMLSGADAPGGLGADNTAGESAGDSAGPVKEVRVPVSRNSLAAIVNGGVKLPSGVEQQLFVVKAH